MNKKFRTLQISFIMALILSVLIGCLPLGNTVDLSPTETVLAFLKDVVTLDMTTYDATLKVGPITRTRSDLGGLLETTGQYSLVGENSKLDITFRFINGTLTWCLMDIMEGSPKYNQTKAVDFGEATRGFIQRYSQFYDSPISALPSDLSQVDFTKNSSTIIGNLKIKVEIDSASSAFSASNTFYGAEYGSFGVTFENTNFRVFGDSRSYYRVGDPTVSVSQEQAVNIALERAKGFSYTYAGSVIKDFGIVEDDVTAELLTKSKFEPLELYPYWRVTLPLDDFYPGYVTSIMVDIWAGTSEVIAVYPMGVGGGPTPEESPEPSASPQPSATPTVTTSPTPTTTSPSIAPSASSSPSQSAQETTMPPQSPLATPVASLQPEVTPVGSGGLDVWLVAVGVVVAVVAAAVSVLVLKGKVRVKV